MQARNEIEVGGHDSAVSFTDYDPFARQPSDESLGYYQSSANADWAEILFIQGRRESSLLR
jgi:hypothetical protein